MTSLGYLSIVIIVCSLFIAYHLSLKIFRKTDNQGKMLEKVFIIIFTSLILCILNSLTFITSYSYFWEKAYRSITENKYEAIVVGYQQEISSSKSSFNNTYLPNKKIIYFPKVRYTNSEGQEVTKKLDITSDKPLKIGKKIKITDNTEISNANTLQLDWFVFLGGSLLTGIAAFFSYLVSSYIGAYQMKKRVINSCYYGFSLMLFNILCIIIINLN